MNLSFYRIFAMDPSILVIFVQSFNEPMNIKEKELIEALLDTENKMRHDRAVSILFFEKNIISNTIRNAVSKCFSGRLYLHNEVYDVFVILFLEHLKNIHREKYAEVENLPAWMYRTATNFANSNRKRINVELGIDGEFVTFGREQDVDESTVETETSVQSATEEGDVSPSDWAANLLNKYIAQISNPYYRTILYAVDVHGMTLADFAEEQGKELRFINNDHRRAKLALIQVALPDIRWRSRALFDNFNDILTDDDAATLRHFFDRSANIDPKDVALVYSRLLKITKRENERKKKETRKEMRIEKRMAKESQKNRNTKDSEI